MFYYEFVNNLYLSGVGGSGKTAILLQYLTSSIRASASWGTRIEGLQGYRRELQEQLSANADVVWIDGYQTHVFECKWPLALSSVRFEQISQLLRGSSRLVELRRLLRLASAAVSRLVMVLRRFPPAYKKAVSERPFFVVHETHPPEQTVDSDGLLVGAFQAA